MHTRCDKHRRPPMKFELLSAPLASRVAMTRDAAFHCSVMVPLDDTDVQCVSGIAGSQVGRDSLTKSLSRDHMHLSSRSVWTERRGPWRGRWSRARVTGVAASALTEAGSEGRPPCPGVPFQKPRHVTKCQPWAQSPGKGFLSGSFCGKEADDSKEGTEGNEE